MAQLQLYGEIRMRGSRIFAGLVIIALIAIALIYLEDRGVFSNSNVDRLGLLKSNDTMPKPATDTDKPPISADGQTPPATVAPPDTTTPATPAASTTTTNEAVATAQDAANNVPTRPGASKTVYVDSQGNVCRPIQEPVVVHHYHHRRIIRDNWTYQPAMGRISTPCGVIHQTATGQRVVNLQSGMVLNIALNQPLSTMDTTTGQDFTGYLVGPITYCGEVIVPAGATVEGTVMSSRRHTRGQEDDSVLQLRLSAMDANGYRVPLVATSSNRRSPDDVHYKTTNYMNDPNYIETTHTSSHDVMLPAQSVVSFWLQGSTPVYF
jgi:hypothetical protein